MNYRLLRNKSGTNEIHDAAGVCTHVVVPVEPTAPMITSFQCARRNHFPYDWSDPAHNDGYKALLAAAPADLAGAVVRLPERRTSTLWGLIAEGWNEYADALARALEVSK
jgi:hypothetical protein